MIAWPSVEDPALVAPGYFALIDSFKNFKSSIDCITSSLFVEIAELLSRSFHSRCRIPESNKDWESVDHIPQSGLLFQPS
jgi:hypothetical protein